jgi:superfamily II DNA/RNA helicase
MTTNRGGGSALAVDLRRTRAARRRAERALTPPAAPRPQAFLVVCGGREPLESVREWFSRHDRTPFPFQEAVWQACLAGESGLVHAATDTGKTYAAWLSPVLE